MERYQEDDGGSTRGGGGGGGGGGSAEPAFRTVPRDQTTFLVWKVTDKAVELLPRTHYGTFYDTDAYLVYSASLAGQPAGPDVIRREIKETGEPVAERHIHTWSGARSGTAAALRRAAQLAAHVAAPAALHREAPGAESPRLLAYFRDGLRLLHGSRGGGADAARLYRVRGRRPVLEQVAAGWAALDARAVLLLDAPPHLVLWLGRTAPLHEKMFGAKIAYRMSRGPERGLRARRITIAHDGYEQTLAAAERAALEAALQPSRRGLRSAPPPPAPRAARLFRVHAAPAPRLAARLEEVGRAPLARHQMQDDGVYIVDAESRGIWAWVGAAARGAAARGALAAARGLARARGLSACVSAVRAGCEPLQFAALFRGWPAPAVAARRDRLRAARCATSRLDADSLAANAWLAAETQLPDDGSGALRVWRVRRAGEAAAGDGGGAGAGGGGAGAGGGVCEVPQPQQAVFFDADCYVALYTYHAPTGDQSVIYYWMGGSSPNDLRNLGAKEAKDLFIKLGRLPVQAWVYQGKEPAHFLQIFKGRMITYVGSATDYDPTGRRLVPPSHALIRVSGAYSREARGTELRAGAGAGTQGAAGAGAEGTAGAGACYVLRGGARTWVWCGAGASGDEREVAKNMAACDHVLLMQGKETAEFWSALGARRALLAPSPPPPPAPPLPPRLFYVAAHSPGHYVFEEIVSFTQASLAPELACVVDAQGGVWAWLGAHADARPEAARELAAAYLLHDPSARDPETPTLAVRQGREPPHFTGLFPHWKPSLWKGHKTFSAIISALEGKAIVQTSGAAPGAGGGGELRFDRHEKYPLHVLRGPRDQLPPDVDPLAKELYLTHDEFVATFGMAYGVFRALPAWKQREVKKLVGLF